MTTITICGSMDFFEEMSAVADDLRSRGFRAFLPTAEGTSSDYNRMTDAEVMSLKSLFINDHFAKIKNSEGVLLANYEKKGISGYIGANTLMEAAFSYALNKKLFILNEVGEQSCRSEILGIQPTFLNGNLAMIEASFPEVYGSQK